MRPLFAHPAIDLRGAAMVRTPSFTALEMLMRPAQPLSLFVFAACTAAAFAGLAHAQDAASSVTNSAAPTAPLHHAPLPASGNVETVETNWRNANTAVAAFPRGHMDILVWEAKQAHGTDAAAPMDHGMHPQTTPIRPGAKP